MIVIFGMGIEGGVIYDKIQSDECICFFDNNRDVWGGETYNTRILSSKEFADLIRDGNVSKIYIHHKYIEDMLFQCLGYGAEVDYILYRDPKKDIFRPVVDYYANNVFSQDGEECYLRQKYIKQNRGVFVDVGANHPFLYSNSYWASCMGWRVINIEPDEENYRKLQLVRKKDLNINVGVSDKQGELTLYRFDCHQANTFDKNRRDYLVNQLGFKVKNTKKIQVLPLREIFYAYNISVIDVLDIDAEDMDLNVLRGIDFDRVDIESILIEQREKSLRGVLNSDINSYLEEKGYVAVSKYNRTVIYESKY